MLVLLLRAWVESTDHIRSKLGPPSPHGIPALSWSLDPNTQFFVFFKSCCCCCWCFWFSIYIIMIIYTLFFVTFFTCSSTLACSFSSMMFIDIINLIIIFFIVGRDDLIHELLLRYHFRNLYLLTSTLETRFMQWSPAFVTF